MTSRTIEVLDQRGIADRFLSQGWTGQIGHYSGILIDISDLPTRHNYGLGLPQYRIERTLADWDTTHPDPNIAARARLDLVQHRSTYGEGVAFTQHEADIYRELCATVAVIG